MKDNAEAAGEGLDQRQRLIHKMAGLESRYDSDICMLRSPFSSPGYHTTLKQAEFIHSTRDSLSYALGLLDTELACYEERAFDIIRQVISLQDTDPAHDTFGIWSWFYEEPLDQMAPPDWNWADFCGSRLVQALSRHGHRFPHDLREAAVLSIECACEAIIRRNVGPDYTNIAIIGAFVTRIAGEKLGRKDYADYGLERLRRLHAHTLKHGAFQEYNSPVYTYIAILELSKLQSETSDSRVKAWTRELLELTWRTVSGYYHPATAQWSGPHSRCYGVLLEDQSKAFLQLATGGAVMFFPWEELPYEEEWYMSGIQCPPAYLEGFKVPETKEVRQRLEGEGEGQEQEKGKERKRERGQEQEQKWGQKREQEHGQGQDREQDRDQEREQEREQGQGQGQCQVQGRDQEQGQGQVQNQNQGYDGKWAVTYMTPQWSMGSFTYSDLWNQRRPLLIYANNNGQPSYLRLRCLHDGYDYCSARFQSLQEAGHVLFGIDFITDGGDTHPNLDRTGGVIAASDLRLRLEVGGALEGVTAALTEEGTVITIAGTEFGLTTWFAAFSGQADAGNRLVWELHKADGRMNIDMILYAGPRRMLDFTSMQQAALVFSLAAGEEGRLNSALLLELTDEGGLRVSSGSEHEGGRVQGVAGGKAAGANKVNEWNEVNEANENDETNAAKGERGVRVVNSMNSMNSVNSMKSMKGGFVLSLRPAPGE
ncbi:hypothetical protein [Paenibacillus sp. FSL H3-0333]|uniref:hypothetical protein n=1 Tax=Paenibacillus sp. FSL H3-0333 TaxID=2921373 RepID=UPI0030F4FCB2